MKLLARWDHRLVFLLVLAATAVFLSCSDCNSERDQWLAGKIASSSFEWDEQSARDYDLPTSVSGKDDAIVYLLERADGCSPNGYRGSSYFLGVYFLPRDCEKAKGYLRKHLQNQPDHTEVARLLEMAEGKGCSWAAEAASRDESPTAPGTAP